MVLQTQLKKDLQLAMKAKDEVKRDTLRVVMGEMARSEKKQFTDDEIISILKKLIKSEKEMLEKSGQGTSSAFIDIISAYLPALATEDEIRHWISSNVDFSKYKNKMQAMGLIMGHFKASADGSMVKRVLEAYNP